MKAIVPERLSELDRAQFERLTVGIGNHPMAVADVFDVDWGDPSDLTIRLQGDLRTACWVGHRMTAGKMIVESDLGDFAGCQMSGGRIEVAGSVGTYAAAEMSGGSFSVSGNAADWLGAALPGSRIGVSSGDIFVGGDAGDAAGFRMRRGSLVIGGDAGQRLGWDLLAGTIIAAGKVAGGIGRGMIRGTILTISPEFAPANRDCLPATFSIGGQFQLPFLPLLKRELGLEFEKDDWANRRYAMFHGDHLKGGRGEVFAPVV